MGVGVLGQRRRRGEGQMVHSLMDHVCTSHSCGGYTAVVRTGRGSVHVTNSTRVVGVSERPESMIEVSSTEHRGPGLPTEKLARNNVR